jgi:hypothetical protein
MDIPPDGYSGFATTRFVRASSEAEAMERALALVATTVASEPAFSTSPPPTLAIDRVVRVRSPLKLSRPNKGYCFVGSDAELGAAGWRRMVPVTQVVPNNSFKPKPLRGSA